MNNISNFIIEKLNKINSKVEVKEYKPHTYEQLRAMVYDTLQKDKDADLNFIDVSEIEDFGALFQNLDPHNIDVSDWNTSKVIYMDSVFKGCHNLNCDVSKWDVSKVVNMTYMFQGCQKFDCDLSEWDVSQVVNMDNIFYECTNFTAKGLENWNIKSLKSIKYGFAYCRRLLNVFDKWKSSMVLNAQGAFWASNLRNIKL